MHWVLTMWPFTHYYAAFYRFSYSALRSLHVGHVQTGSAQALAPKINKRSGSRPPNVELVKKGELFAQNTSSTCYSFYVRARTESTLYFGTRLKRSVRRPSGHSVPLSSPSQRLVRWLTSGTRRKTRVAPHRSLPVGAIRWKPNSCGLRNAHGGQSFKAFREKRWCSLHIMG